MLTPPGESASHACCEYEYEKKELERKDREKGRTSQINEDGCTNVVDEGYAENSDEDERNGNKSSEDKRAKKVLWLVIENLHSDTYV